MIRCCGNLSMIAGSINSLEPEISMLQNPNQYYMRIYSVGTKIYPGSTAVYTQPCVYTAVDLNLDLPGTAVDLLLHAVPGCTLEYFPILPGY